MGKNYIKFHSIGFSYNGSAESLFRNFTFHLSQGWTGIIGANGSGKTTLLKLSTGKLQPEEGNIEIPKNVLYCSQDTENIPEGLEVLINTFDRETNILKDRLKIEYDWFLRWETLSHGERKRAQIAIALWQNPTVLALDEPTNHLDAETKYMLMNALKLYKGIGLLVSHNRELLDQLCQQNLFIESKNIIKRVGNFSKGEKINTEERESVEHHKLQLKKSIKKIDTEMKRRKEIVEKSKKRLSKKNLSHKDHDAKSKRDLAQLTGKDSIAGKFKKQLDKRIVQLQNKSDSILTKKQYSLGVHFNWDVSKRNYIFNIPSGSISMGNLKKIDYPQLFMRPTDKISISGVNGSGKSTLIRFILSQIPLPKDYIAYIPQEINRKDSQNLLKKIKNFSNLELGALMTIISRLDSRPNRLLNSNSPSPGETRKLLLAQNILNNPQIIIMDEPTNHMDLPSILCLENALSEISCALLLVSHDTFFTNKITDTHWTIKKGPDNLTWKLE